MSKDLLVKTTVEVLYLHSNRCVGGFIELLLNWGLPRGLYRVCKEGEEGLVF